MKHFLRAALVALTLSASALAGAQTTLLNVSYDLSREYFRDINAAFIAQQLASSGQTITINQSTVAPARRRAPSPTAWRPTW